MLEPPRNVTPDRPGQEARPASHWLRRSLLDAYCHCSLSPMPQGLSEEREEADALDDERDGDGVDRADTPD